MRSRFIMMFVVAAILCGFATAADTQTKVFVSIIPQKYFVEKIAGPSIQVEVLVGTGRSPATYEPTPKQMASLSTAKAFFRIGVPFENSFIPKISSLAPKLKIVDTRQGIALREMNAHHHHDEHEDHAEEHHNDHDGKHHDHEEDHHNDHDGEHHDHEEDHEKGHHHGKHKEHAEHDEHKKEHHHGGAKDPHIWLSPKLVKQQAKTICRALCEIDPQNGGEYSRNLIKFEQEIDRLDSELSRMLSSVKGKKLYVFHPSYGYFADAYGLKQAAIEIGGKSPSARELAKFIKMAKAEKVKAIFIQPQFSRTSANAVARPINARIVVLDPLAENWKSNLLDMAGKIRESLF